MNPITWLLALGAVNAAAFQGQNDLYGQQRLQAQSGASSLAAVANDAMKRVVTLLNDMKDKIEEEGRTEKVLFDKFMCWCEGGFKEKEEAIKNRKEGILILHPRIQDARTQITLLTSKLETLEKEIADGKQALQTAMELREKEAKSYESETTSMKESISGLTKALEVLNKKMQVSLPQLQGVVAMVQRSLLPYSQTEGLVKTCLQDENFQAFLMAARDPRAAAALLQQPSRPGAGPSAAFGQVIGMMTHMKETFEADLKEAEQVEAQAVAAHDSLVSSKTDEISADVSMVQKETEEQAALQIQLSQDEADLVDSQKTLAEDEKFYKDMKSECGTKTHEWTVRSQMRLTETTAISEAMNILMEDDEVVSFHRVQRVDPAGGLPGAQPVLLNTGFGGSSMQMPQQPQLQMLQMPQQLPEAPQFQVSQQLQQPISPADFNNGFSVQSEQVLPMSQNMAFPGMQGVLAFVQTAATVRQTSFLSSPSGTTATLEKFMGVIQSHLQQNPRNTALSQLASKVKLLLDGGMTKENFHAIVAVVQQTITVMGMEQKEDDDHLSWCNSEIAQCEAGTQMNEEEEKNLKVAIEGYDNQLQTVNAMIAQLKKEMAEIVVQRNDATKTRLEEQRNYDSELVELKEAQQALYKAIKVLQEVYGEQKALLQQRTAQARGNVPPAPETWTAPYEGQEGGKNILQMLAEIGEDLVKQEDEAKKEEEEAKKTFDQNMKDYDEDTRLKQEQLVSNSALKAKLELQRETAEGDLDSVEEALDSLRAQRLELAGSCNFIIKNHAERKRLRAAEVGNMNEAISVLEAER
jgi:hypothetical protein